MGRYDDDEAAEAASLLLLPDDDADGALDVLTVVVVDAAV
jgi:hypothetical protein